MTNAGALPIYINTVKAGIPLEAPPAASDGVRIERGYYTRDGNSVRPDQLVQGESYIVGLTIIPERRLQHFIITDVLPAGLEVQNPRLAPAQDLPIVGEENPQRIWPSHLEIRDDRVILAFDDVAVSKRRYVYCYIVDAVTPGSYQQPPLVGEAMYDATTFSRTDSGRVVVHPADLP